MRNLARGVKSSRHHYQLLLCDASHHGCRPLSGALGPPCLRLIHCRSYRSLSLSATKAPPSLDEASGANSTIEQNRREIAEEEQELIAWGPDPVELVAKEIGAMDHSQFIEEAAALVRTEGLVRLDGVLSSDEAAALRVHCDQLLQDAREQVASDDGGASYLDLFGPVMSRSARYDLLLPPDDPHVRAATRGILSGDAAQQRVGAIMRALVGEEAYLCELTALVSDPGAVAQPVHHDTTFEQTPRVALLVALQDVDEAMGPTMFWPRTNTTDWHTRYLLRDDELEGLLNKTPHSRALLRAGDAVLYDTNVLHCGAANTADCTEGEGRRRMLLVVSAQEEDDSNREEHANIREGWRRKLKIRDIDSKGQE